MPRDRIKKKREWEKKLPPYEVGLDGFTYLNIPRDEDGWADATLYLPLPYELVCMKTEGSFINNRFKNGWWTGQNWEGIRLKPEEIVLWWKKVTEMGS